MAFHKMVREPSSLPFRESHPELALCVTENEPGTIPAGLNQAGAAARGEIIIRLDAHSIPIPEYVERCVDALEKGKGTIVGGIWEVRAGGAGSLASGIAEAAGHPLGVGDAMYRLHASAGAVDTVPFGAFRRSLFLKMGGYDETLLANEDYEFNTRVRLAGGIVWLDPRIRSTYIARASLSALARQYWRYGYWKFRMLQRHPGSMRWRQALPPLFVAGLIGLGLLSSFLPPARFLLLLGAAIYLLVVAAAGIQVAVRRRRSLLSVGLPLAILTMHIAWGSGFLWSLFSSPFGKHG